jgi:hypothetical protein
MKIKRLVRYASYAAAVAVLTYLGVQLLSPARGQLPVAGGKPPTTLQAVSPFQLIGIMQDATLDTPDDIFSGGSVTVNGIKVTIPRNTLFQFPATTMTWQEMFELAPPPYGLATDSGPQSGLALNDTPPPFASYEVTVEGNRVITTAGDAYVAALVFVSQQSLNLGQGFINAIDYGTGEMWVGAALQSNSGARIRLNTPRGRFGRPDPAADPRFTSDEDNPTISADTGYPMCVPRTDPLVADDALCPQRNRPGDPKTGVYATIYTMPAPGPLLAATAPDATQQAPFEVGDAIQYSGTLVKDPDCTPSAADSCEYISAHTVHANLGIFTSPGVMPAYVTIEAMLLGVGGAPSPLFPQEAVEKLVMVAFSTDSTELVDIYAVDVDACGTESNRYYATGDPSGPPIDKKGRARVRTTAGNFLPATREMRVASRTFTQSRPIDEVLSGARTYANGLIAGQYHAPNFEFILPENFVLGSPIVPGPYQEFPFLAHGTGPYYGAGPNASTESYGNLGPLDPFPGAKPPAQGACAAIADAGPAQTVNSGASVQLDASASHDPNTPPLPMTYEWQQSGGPGVTLSNTTSPNPTFTAPPVANDVPPVVLEFSMRVSNGVATSSIAKVLITVVGPQVPIANAGPNQTVQTPSLVTLTGSATDPNGAAGLPLAFHWTQTGGTAVTLTDADAAVATFPAPTMAPRQPALTLTFTLTVTNALGYSHSASTDVTIEPLKDIVTITSAIWRVNKSRLDVQALSTVGDGVAVLTLHVAGQPDLEMPWDAVATSYVVRGMTVNPAPSTVTVTSSFGGSATADVLIQ